MAPSPTSAHPPDAAEHAYSPPAEGAEGAAEQGRRQGAASVACVPVASVVFAATIAVIRATQSTALGVIGFTAAALAAFAGAAFGIYALARTAFAGGGGRAYSGVVFVATLLNGLLVVAGGLFVFAVLVVSD